MMMMMTVRNCAVAGSPLPCFNEHSMEHPHQNGASLLCTSGPNKPSPPASLSVMKQVASGALTAFIVTTALNSNTANAFEIENAQKIFLRSCSGCHVAGGNILQPGATLASSDLERNGVSAVDDIFKIVYSGKGRMPGFGEQCTPRGQCTFGPRLSDKDIRSLAEFVRFQADNGWVDRK